ncbi:MAG: aromatic/alkene monooxygenase hydroxylase subunit beta [Aquaspirillum sp.]
MQIDLRTVAIRPKRQTFSHIARRQGQDKAASRYQEATLDLQPTANFHYRPYWAPQFEIFDSRRTQIVMKDWYSFKDPRQFYYGTYTMARARQQDAAESAFEFVEDRGLIALLPESCREQALQVLLPLRHLEWGGNMNNTYLCAYGYGTAITQAAMFHAMDRLGIAQYLTRIGLTLSGPDALDTAKAAWLEQAEWQELRRYVEDTFVLDDWFELLVAQNVVLDGLLYPLVYEAFDDAINLQGGTAISMMTQFMRDWKTETNKWLDATLKTAAAESPDNAAQLAQWVAHWQQRAQVALAPVAQLALPETGAAVLEDIAQEFSARMQKLGVRAAQTEGVAA